MSAQSSSIRHRQLPRRRDLDEADRLIWEDLQRLFRKDLLEMEQQLAANEQLALTSSSSPSCRQHRYSVTTRVEPPMTQQLQQQKVVEPTHPSLEVSNPPPSDLVVPFQQPGQQNDSGRMTKRTHSPPMSRRRWMKSCVLCCAMTIMLSTVLSILVIPVVLWATSTLRGALKEPPMFGGHQNNNDGYYLDDDTYVSFMRSHGALESAGGGFRVPRHVPLQSKPSPTPPSQQYAADSAWHTLRSDKLPPLVIPPFVKGRPPPLVWLPRYHARMFPYTNHTHHHDKDDTASTKFPFSHPAAQ